MFWSVGYTLSQQSCAKVLVTTLAIQRLVCLQKPAHTAELPLEFILRLPGWPLEVTCTGVFSQQGAVVAVTWKPHLRGVSRVILEWSILCHLKGFPTGFIHSLVFDLCKQMIYHFQSPSPRSQILWGIWESLPYLHEGYGQLNLAFDVLTSLWEEKFCICENERTLGFLKGSWELLVSLRGLPMKAVMKRTSNSFKWTACSRLNISQNNSKEI